MKRFRGKPEKHKRSNGKIHRRRCSVTVGAQYSGTFMVPLARARHLRNEHSGGVVVHFSPRRTSRTVVYRSTARVGACRIVSAHAADPRSPGRLNDATLTVSGRNQSILTNVFASFQTQARAALTGIYGPSAVPGPADSCAVSSDWPILRLPVGDALLWWCPSYNSFKYQLCNHPIPETKSFVFPEAALRVT